MTDQSVSGLEALGAFATTLHVDRLPSEVVRRAQACLLYGLAVGVASGQASTSTMATAIVTQEYGSLASGLATCLLDGRNISPGAAAFANATLMHARVQEDAHPAGHVGVVVVPAALAMAQHCQATGAELLTSIVAGYEVALRIGRDHAADASERGFRTTPLYGVFGAAAAGAHLLKLEQPRMVSALAFAANMAAGLFMRVQKSFRFMPVLRRVMDFLLRNAGRSGRSPRRRLLRALLVFIEAMVASHSHMVPALLST
jgi:2-methylcitrate dehydratase PrpD